MFDEVFKLFQSSHNPIIPRLLPHVREYLPRTFATGLPQALWHLIHLGDPGIYVTDYINTVSKPREEHLAMSWNYIEDVQPYAFGHAYSDDGKDLKEAALQYLRWYLETCFDAEFVKGETKNVESR